MGTYCSYLYWIETQLETFCGAKSNKNNMQQENNIIWLSVE